MNDTTAILSLVKLRFNIEHPSIEDCYSFGYECAQADIEEENNPFTESTCEYEHWCEGWWAGFYGEEPLFELSGGEQSEVIPSAAANDKNYKDSVGRWLLKAVEVTGVIVVSAVVGYQILEMVA